MKRYTFLFLTLILSEPLGGQVRYTVPGGGPLHTIPPSPCDQRYALGMEQALRLLQGTLPQDILRQAQEYMIMVKQSQDLELEIRRMEFKTFDIVTTARLRIPLRRFQLCRDTFIFQRKGAFTTPPAACDQQYALGMAQTLRQLQRTLNPDSLRLAQQYMIMVKQQQDLDARIRRMEHKTFDIPTVARLRAPLQEYQRCRDIFISLHGAPL